MAKMMEDMTCAGFASALASKESVPGGGGAAAYAGALAAALDGMVARFTTGKRAYADVEEDIQRIIGESDKACMRMMELVDEDAEGFFPLSQAYAIPRDDPGRDEVLERCTKQAIEAPFAMMRVACQVIRLAEELFKKGSKMLISDVGCAAALARASLEAAALSVAVNTSALRDGEYAKRINGECKEMLAEYPSRAQAVVDGVMDMTLA